MLSSTVSMVLLESRPVLSFRLTVEIKLPNKLMLLWKGYSSSPSKAWSWCYPVMLLAWNWGSRLSLPFIFQKWTITVGSCLLGMYCIIIPLLTNSLIIIIFYLQYAFQSLELRYKWKVKVNNVFYWLMYLFKRHGLAVRCVFGSVTWKTYCNKCLSIKILNKPQDYWSGSTSRHDKHGWSELVYWIQWLP